MYVALTSASILIIWFAAIGIVFLAMYLELKFEQCPIWAKAMARTFAWFVTTLAVAIIMLTIVT